MERLIITLLALQFSKADITSILKRKYALSYDIAIPMIEAVIENLHKSLETENK